MPMYITALLLFPSISLGQQTVQSQQMLGTEMCQSSNIYFEPGLDQGAPWGRDLITFMTSAAGYMMRTLQKPRKNKPSKRQVNHRRFLHNMIQRKFAEIETASHQLAPAVHSVDAESQRQSEAKWTHRHGTEQNLKRATAVSGDVETKHLDEDNDTRISGRIVTDPNENSLTSKPLNNLVGKADKLREDEEEVEQSIEILTQEIADLTSEREQFQWAYADFSDLPLITNEDSVFTSFESIEKTTVNSQVPIPNSPDREQQQQHHLGLTSFDLPPTSPLSPLSLNSCQFEIQTRPNNGHASHDAQSFPIDLIGSLELLDAEEYLQKIDQMNMAAVWDVHIEEDLSCFQDNLSFLNTLHTEFAMDKQATCSDGAICEGLQQITTLLENSVKNMNMEYDLRSNVTNSQVHCGSGGHNVQEKQTSATMDCYINHSEISSAVNKEDQYSSRGTWTVSEQRNISSHVLNKPKHDLLDRPQLQNRKQHLCHYNYAPSEVKEPYYMLSDEEKKIMCAGSTLNPNLAHSNAANPISSLTTHCFGFDVPLQANSNCIGDTSTFLNGGGCQSGPCFQGVAQSFPALHENPHPHPVSTPPLNDDWLFSNMATELDFNSMVESHGHAFC